jgi:hypothetical protein
VSHRSGGFADLGLAGASEQVWDNREPSDQGAARHDAVCNFFENRLRVGEVLEDMEEDRTVVAGRERKIRVFEVGFKEVVVADWEEFVREHDGIDGGPLRPGDPGGGGFHKLEHLSAVNSDFGDGERASHAVAFFAKQLVAEPVAEEAEWVADGFCLGRHAEAFGAHGGIVGEEINFPAGCLVGFQSSRVSWADVAAWSRAR